MIPDDVAKPLHAKAARGVALSAEEQACLDAWYAQQDKEESAILTQSQPSQRLAVLRAEVNTAMTQLLAVTQEIQALEAENEKLRREIGALQQQLAQRPTAQLT